MFKRTLAALLLMGCFWLYLWSVDLYSKPKPMQPAITKFSFMPIPSAPPKIPDDPDAIWQESNAICLADVLAYTPRDNWQQMSDELKDNPHVCVIAESLSGHNMLNTTPPKAAMIFAHEAVYATH